MQFDTYENYVIKSHDTIYGCIWGKTNRRVKYKLSKYKS